MSNLRINTLTPYSGGSITISGSTVAVSASNIILKELTNTSQTNILTYNPSTGQVYYTASSNIGGGGVGGVNHELQYNNNGTLDGIPDVGYYTTPGPSFPSSSGANIELTSTNINLITSDVEFGNMGYGVINAVAYISASDSSSYNQNGLSVYPTNATQLNYGVNVIAVADATNFCVKMPATPRKGKELTVINNSGIPIYVFAESELASLNNIIGNHIVLPSDGIAYKFVCYDNPLPGGWSIVSTGASNIINSGVIGGANGFLISQSVLFSPTVNFYQSNGIVNDSIYVLGGVGQGHSNAFSYDLLNNLLHDAQIQLGGTATTSHFTPDPTFFKINNITIYTNFSSSNDSPSSNNPPRLAITLGAYNNINYYQAGTNLLDYPMLDQPGNGIPAALQTFYTNIIDPFAASVGLTTLYEAQAGSILLGGPEGSINQVPGTLDPLYPGYTPISVKDFTGYLSANPGDPGTTYYTMNLTNNLSIGRACGIKFLGTVNTPGAFGASALDVYSFRNMCVNFSLPKTTYINGLKLKIVIDYVELT